MGRVRRKRRRKGEMIHDTVTCEYIHFLFGSMSNDHGADGIVITCSPNRV